MKVFNNIAVVLAPHDDFFVVHEALAIAQRFGSPLSVLQSDAMPLLGPLASGAFAEAKNDRLPLGIQDVETRQLVLPDSDFDVESLVRQHGFDLVIKSSSRGNLTSRFLRPHDGPLLWNCPCPVWLVPRSRKADTGADIVAAIKPCEHDHILNRHILQTAGGVAKQLGARLHLVSAWSLVGESMLRRPARSGLTRADVDRYVAEARDDACMVLSELLKAVDLGGVNCRAHFRKGTAVSVLANVSERFRPKLVVLGAPSQSWLPDWLSALQRNVVTEFLNRATAPLLVTGGEAPIQARLPAVLQQAS